MRAALIDYGSGNIASAAKALSRAAGETSGHEIVVTADPDIVRKAERIVLPGVGAFADCMRGLGAVPGMVEALNESVIRNGKPILGICVGMQLMATAGREFGIHSGLNWIGGEVLPLLPADPLLKIPHMGWNEINLVHNHPLFAGLDSSANAYFVHSFEMKPDNERSSFGDRRLWRRRHRRNRARQYRGHAIPSRKEPGCGPENSGQFPELDAMIIFPAIDLKDGQCVRLKRGIMEDATVFNADPAAQAKNFKAQGFRWLHCVDLNGAFEGRSANAEAIKSIRAAIDLPIQLGGGIRDRAAVDAWLEAGITRVILGTAALTDPGFRERGGARPSRPHRGRRRRQGREDRHPGLGRGQRTHPGGTGQALRGCRGRRSSLHRYRWRRIAAGRECEGHRRLGPRALAIPVIASGGVGSLADIEALMAADETNIEGVVVGRALYDGRIDPAQALRLARCGLAAAQGGG